MKDNSAYSPLGKYIQLSKEKNTQLLATRHFGLSASEGLVEQEKDLESFKQKSCDYLLRRGQLACDLINFGKTGSLNFDLYREENLATVSRGNATVFSVENNFLNGEYLSLILRSERTKNILKYFACHGCHMVLPWEDFCSLTIRVPPPQQQAELVRKYSTVEKVIKLKRKINETLEEWMEDYYHILFDNLPEEQLEQKKLGDLFLVKGGATPSTNFPEYFCKEGGIPWVGIRDLTNNKSKFISRGETNITEKGHKSCSTYIIPRNSILFSCRGTIGVMAVNDQEICFTQGLFGLFGENFLKNYYWFLLKDNLEEIKGLGKGTVMSGMGQQDLRDFQINLPPRLLMVTFNQICEPFFQLQKTNEQEIRELIKLQQYFIEQTN